MPITSLMPIPKQQYFAIAGIPLVGGKIYTYAAGTTTPKVTYSDSAGTVAQANPIILNARGEPVSPIFWSGSYKVEVRDALNNIVYTVDNYNTDPAGLWGLAATLLGNIGASLIGFIQAGTGAVPRTVQDKLRDLVNVRDFGAKGDGVADDTASINAALNAARTVYIPAGTYNISGPINITKDGHKFYGDGKAATKIVCTSAGTYGIVIASGLTGFDLSGFTLTRSVTPTIVGSGIVLFGTTSSSSIRDINVTKHYYGIYLGTTDISRMQDVHADSNVSHGFYFTTVYPNCAMQWYLNACYSGSNGGDGFSFRSIAVSPGTGNSTLGSMTNCFTYGNSGHGVAFIGLPSNPISGVRLLGGFYGNDGSDEVYLDTYGGQHTITGVFAELAGCDVTGPGGSVARSFAGNGVYVTSNNADVSISALHANGNSFNGIKSLAPSTLVAGGSVLTNNGLALVAGERSGLRIAVAARLIANGIVAGNLGGGTSQLVGITVEDGANTVMMACDLTNNSGSASLVISNPNLTVRIGCLPAGGGIQLGNDGASLGNVVIGGTGELNVSTNIKKNGTVYANP